jgi:hypothetical protein
VERVVGVMRSTDGRWRVEAVRERQRHWYRVWRGTGVYADHLFIGELLRVLNEAGVQLSDLTEE